MPAPLIAGFMAGIGALIVSRQAASALGITKMQMEENRTLLECLSDPSLLVDMIHLPSVGLIGLTLLSAMVLPKLYPRAPAIMIAAAASTVVQALFQFPGVEMVGQLPASLPAPSMPHLPSSNDMGGIVLSSFVFVRLFPPKFRQQTNNNKKKTADL